MAQAKATKEGTAIPPKVGFFQGLILWLRRGRRAHLPRTQERVSLFHSSGQGGSGDEGASVRTARVGDSSTLLSTAAAVGQGGRPPALPPVVKQRRESKHWKRPKSPLYNWSLGAISLPLRLVSPLFFPAAALLPSAAGERSCCCGPRRFWLCLASAGFTQTTVVWRTSAATG